MSSITSRLDVQPGHPDPSLAVGERVEGGILALPPAMHRWCLPTDLPPEAGEGTRRGSGEPRDPGYHSSMSYGGVVARQDPRGYMVTPWQAKCSL